MKPCSKCGIEKEDSRFLKDPRNKGGLTSDCRDCRSAAKRAWAKRNADKVRDYNRRWNAANPEKKRNMKKLYRQRHPERARAQVLASIRKKWDTKYRPERWRKWLKEKYGITEEQFDALVKKQRNKCAICKNGQSQGPRRPNLCVDHCHNSKRLRGLLCFQCNVMLGAAKDSIKTLRAAIRYLKEYA